MKTMLQGAKLGDLNVEFLDDKLYILKTKLI